MPERFPIVDAHQHFWDLALRKHPWLMSAPPHAFRYGDTTPLRREYLVPDYLRDAGGWEIAASVYVETEWDPRDPTGEVRWVEGVAAEFGLPRAVVAQAWLDREDCADVLAAHARSPLVRGVRHKPAAASEPRAVVPGAPGSMGDPRWRAGFALLARHSLSFDLQTPWWHLEEAADLARAFPETTIVLNHTGLPARRDDQGITGWRRAMAVLARENNVFVKISGLGLPGRRWSAADNAGIVLDTIDLFGVDRCLFASNFPVDGLVGDFEGIFDGFSAITRGLSRADRARLFRENALRVYRIG